MICAYSDLKTLLCRMKEQGWRGSCRSRTGVRQQRADESDQTFNSEVQLEPLFERDGHFLSLHVTGNHNESTAGYITNQDCP